MSLSIPGLAGAIGSELDSLVGTPLTGQPATNQANFCTALATAIVNYLKANTVVSTNDVGTVTSGVGSGGTVVATGTGTIS